MSDIVVGIGFYRREQWPLLLDTAADAHIMEKTYDEWLEVLDSSLEKIRKHGIEPELVEVDVIEFLDFCKEHGIQNDASARSRFIVKLSEKNKQKSP